MSKVEKSNHVERVVFDGASFAKAIAGVRHAKRLSTRDVARRAGVSQAYVVALERVHVYPGYAGPVPTVEVLARIAYALDLNPTKLFEQSVRPAGRHVLLVIDNLQHSVMESVHSFAGGDVTTWLAADLDSLRPREPTTNAKSSSNVLALRLNRSKRRRYEPEVISASVEKELKDLTSSIHGREIGLVFAGMSQVLETLQNPNELIDFECQWADVVATAAKGAGAHATWNVCIYSSDALRALPDPSSALVNLVRSHDSVWSINSEQHTRGERGVRNIVEKLRPGNTSDRAWRIESKRIVREALAS